MMTVLPYLSKTSEQYAHSSDLGRVRVIACLSSCLESSHIPSDGRPCLEAVFWSSRGGVAAPLIEPDVQISCIRLTRESLARAFVPEVA